ncbi:MAG: HmuY family protein [Xanthomarina gelatinilytica]|uniref:HmuY family protein n=1 Tax=Xanthomarina gelatinilytica TaxID=1137281 RepID=UPI003A844B43
MNHLKQIFIYTIIAFGVILNSSCSEDNDFVSDPFVVAFETPSGNILEIETQQNIGLVYSKTAIENGSVSIMVDAQNAVYGVDFTTQPEVVNNTITLAISQGETANNIIFNKINSGLDETTEIEFLITEISYTDSNIQGSTYYKLNALASEGGSSLPEIGGPNQGNQVYIDLSTNTETNVWRDSWDLGFYSGSESRVVLNGSIYMATTALEFTDIDAVTQSDVSALQSEVAMGTFNPANEAYIDVPDGDITGTAIAEISDDNSQNKVYLLNLGYEVGTNTPTIGSAEVAGAHRGWKKIRILKSGNDYILQYANIDSNTHQEITIGKNPDYNFSFFSFNTESEVSVEPEKDRWDICFSVFTNVIAGAGSYGYSDFVFHNRKGDVTAYMFEATTDLTYDSFTSSDIDNSLLLEDQRVIGSTWRDVFSGTPFNNKFYILKDPNGNFYKIRFLALTNDIGERGYPEFEFELLQ